MNWPPRQESNLDNRLRRPRRGSTTTRREEEDRGLEPHADDGRANRVPDDLRPRRICLPSASFALTAREHDHDGRIRPAWMGDIDRGCARVARQGEHDARAIPRSVGRRRRAGARTRLARYGADAKSGREIRGPVSRHGPGRGSSAWSRHRRLRQRVEPTQCSRRSTAARRRAGLPPRDGSAARRAATSASSADAAASCRLAQACGSPCGRCTRSRR